MNEKLKTIGVVAIVVSIVLWIGGCVFVFPLATAETVRFTVKDKERVTTGSGDSLSSKYLIYTNAETFENTDSLVYGKFDSSDLYGQLAPGETYDAKVYGWRIPVLSSYRNIVNATRVTD